VYATARTPSKVTGLTCKVKQLDVNSVDSVKACVDELIAEQGRIDVLINNAAIGMIGAAAEMPRDHMMRIFNTNVCGVLSVCNQVLKHLIPAGQGLIANVGSVLGTISTPWGGPYSASKMAIPALTQSMRLELAPYGIKVTLILPGTIRSNIAKTNVNNDQVYIPSDTMFSYFVDAIQARALISQTGNATPTDVFARHVLAKLLVNKPRTEIWYGATSGMFWILGWFPKGVVEWIWKRVFKLPDRVPRPQLKSE
jgi:1-acylglycerone phosphate reductase